MDIQAILAKIKQYPVAVGCAIGALVLLVVIWLRMPHLPNLEQLANDRDETSNTIARNLKEAVGIEEDSEELAEYVANIERRLMHPDRKAINYQFFYGLEENSGVRITGLNQVGVVSSTGKPPPDKPALTLYTPIQYSIAIAGTWDQCMEFLYLLETGNFFPRYEAFSVGETRGDDAEQLVSMSFTLEMLGVQ